MKYVLLRSKAFVRAARKTLKRQLAHMTKFTNVVAKLSTSDRYSQAIT